MIDHPDIYDEIITEFYHVFQNQYMKDKSNGRVEACLGRHVIAKSISLRFPVQSKELDRLIHKVVLRDLRNLQSILPEKCQLFVVSRSECSDSLEIIW